MFKIRCSAIGQIMTNSRTKGDLSKTAQTYCQGWVKEQIYLRYKDIQSKYLTKGIEQEEGAIDFISEYYNLGMLFKNEKHFSNEYAQGTPDVIYSGSVRDIKCSWDCFTFPLFDSDPNKDYWWQLQGYMWLTGAKYAYLDYVLMDTPDSIIDDELTRLAYKGLLTEEKEEQIRNYHTYSNLDADKRVKTFEFERDNEAINKIQNRVIECREYIDSLGFIDKIK